MFSNPHYVHPQVAEVWRRAGDRLAAQAEALSRPRRIFVSRRLANRSCRNREDVEQVFVDHGFEVVFPEELSLAEQVQMFRAAGVVGGFAGSGMFQLAFVTEPTRAIQVVSAPCRPRNEYLISAVRPARRRQHRVQRRRGRRSRQVLGLPLRRAAGGPAPASAARGPPSIRSDPTRRLTDQSQLRLGSASPALRDQPFLGAPTDQPTPAAPMSQRDVGG
ncbi:DUF563 domain-containing protein [Nocardioides kongjuensis]|uniref:glycosyltransferase family 61 protein n=1 Tax=Nocardioides kongjuensis TaxID=349522 RepID=UPI0015C7716D